MNVLQFAREDFAGVASKIRDALTKAGHSCRLVCEINNTFDYPKDIKRAHPSIPQLVKDADTIIAHTSPKYCGGWGNAKRILYVHGTRFRKSPAPTVKWARRMGVQVVCSTIDLTRHGPNIIYNPTPIDGVALRSMAQKNQKPRGPLRVAHSPTSRKGKGTREFLDACAALDGVEPVLIEKVSNAECLRIKSTCHASFDSLVIGFQVSGIEAAAMGMPVLAGGDRYVLDETIRRFGFQPYLYVRGGADIKAQLERLRDDAKYFGTWQSRALRAINEHHDHRASARYMATWL